MIQCRAQEGAITDLFWGCVFACICVCVIVDTISVCVGVCVCGGRYVCGRVSMYVCACLYVCVIGRYNHMFRTDRNASLFHRTEWMVQCTAELYSAMCEQIPSQ